MPARLKSFFIHLPAFVAAGAVGLYILGMVKTTGQLRASHVQVSQAMGLIPLERHLRNALGILISPAFLVLLPAYALMYAGARGAAAGRSDNTDAVATRADRASAVFDRVSRVIVPLMGLFIAVVMPWPFIILELIVVASWVGAAVLPRVWPETWAARRAEAYVLCSVLALVLISALDGYFRAAPLPRATLITAHGRMVAPLIGATEGLIYLAPNRHRALYAAVPASSVRTLTVAPQKRKEEPSLLQLAGIDWPRSRD